jgi:hypothetical protein
VAGIEYRTVLDGATYREAVADVRSAMRFLRAHADAYGFDAGKVAVWGESAGGVPRRDDRRHRWRARVRDARQRGARPRRGRGDRVVSLSQTLPLHMALLAQGIDSTGYVLDGADHGGMAALLGDPEAVLPWTTHAGRVSGAGSHLFAYAAIAGFMNLLTGAST